MSLTTHTSRTVVSVDELRRAWLAVQDGQFRAHTARCDAGPESPARPGSSWQATGRTIPVVGATGSAGASTTALAMTTAAGVARLIECATITTSGVCAATTAELGRHDSGWLQGRRDDILIERCGDVLLGPHDVPLPAPTDLPVTVLDVGWELGQVLAGNGWLSEHLLNAPAVIVVGTATVPGLRRLEGVLALLTHTRVVAAVIGPSRRRWPRELSHCIGALTSCVDQRGDLIALPYDSGLAVRGLDSTPLPPALVKAAARLLTQAAGTELDPKETFR